VLGEHAAAQGREFGNVEWLVQHGHRARFLSPPVNLLAAERLDRHRGLD
jgi:hypothetical protein